MCRLRIPGGQLSAWQLRGIADLADRFAGGYSHVTTRANLQLREIPPKHTPGLLMGLAELGLTSRGAGADNIRNVTGSPTAGVDPQELIDTQPLCREMHHYILNHRELYGLPRKFNIAFDGGGRVASLADTNDIGFDAVRVPEGRSVPAGVYFRLGLGGITGHRDFARDEGVLLAPGECVKVADAVLRVFIEHGDRTDRTKARMKYVIDRLGHEKYLELRGGKARPQARAPGARRLRAAPRRGQARPCGLPRAEAGRPLVRGHRRSRGQAHLGADARRGLHRRALRERIDPAHRLAEPARHRHPRGLDRRRESRDRGPRARLAGLGPARRDSSPAPATRAASSPHPTPRATRSRSPTTWRRA